MQQIVVQTLLIVFQFSARYKNIAYNISTCSITTMRVFEKGIDKPSSTQKNLIRALVTIFQFY